MKCFGQILKKNSVEISFANMTNLASWDKEKKSEDYLNFLKRQIYYWQHEPFTMEDLNKDYMQITTELSVDNPTDLAEESTILTSAFST